MMCMSICNVYDILGIYYDVHGYQSYMTFWVYMYMAISQFQEENYMDEYLCKVYAHTHNTSFC